MKLIHAHQATWVCKEYLWKMGSITAGTNISLGIEIIFQKVWKKKKNISLIMVAVGEKLKESL